MKRDFPSYNRWIAWITLQAFLLLQLPGVVWSWEETSVGQDQNHLSQTLRRIQRQEAQAGEIQSGLSAGLEEWDGRVAQFYSGAQIALIGTGMVGGNYLDALLNVHGEQLGGVRLLSTRPPERVFDALLGPAPHLDKLTSVQGTFLNIDHLQQVMEGAQGVFSPASLAWQHPKLGREFTPEDLLVWQLRDNAIAPALMGNLLGADQRFVWTSSSAINYMLNRLNPADTATLMEEIRGRAKRYREYARRIVASGTNKPAAEIEDFLSRDLQTFPPGEFPSQVGSDGSVVYAVAYSYPYSKLVGQTILEAIGEDEGKAIAVLNISDVYGPGQRLNDPQARRAQRFMQRHLEVLGGTEHWLTGENGFRKPADQIEQVVWNDWVAPTFVGDMIQMTHRAFVAELPPGKVTLNVLAPWIRNIQMAEAIRDAVGTTQVEIVTEQPLMAEVPWVGEDWGLLGYPTTPVELTGVLTSLEDGFRTHLSWWETQGGLEEQTTGRYVFVVKPAEGRGWLEPRTSRVARNVQQILSRFQIVSETSPLTLAAGVVDGAYRLDIQNRSGGNAEVPPIALDEVIANAVDGVSKRAKQSGRDVIGVITVRETRNGGRWSLEVSDNGFGIEADRLPHLFDEAGASDKTDPIPRTVGGDGDALRLGMYGNQLMAGHGGVIEVESRTSGAPSALLLRQDPSSGEGTILSGDRPSQGTTARWVFPGLVVPDASFQGDSPVDVRQADRFRIGFDLLPDMREYSLEAIRSYVISELRRWLAETDLVSEGSPLALNEGPNILDRLELRNRAPGWRARQTILLDAPVTNSINALADLAEQRGRWTSGWIEVRLRQAESGWVLELEDNGPGIAEPRLARLFRENLGWSNRSIMDRLGGGGKSFFQGALGDAFLIYHGGRVEIETRDAETGAHRLVFVPSFNREAIVTEVSPAEKAQLGTIVRWIFSNQEVGLTAGPASLAEQGGLEERWDLDSEVLPILSYYPRRDSLPNGGALYGRTDPETRRGHVERVLRIAQIVAAEMEIPAGEQRLLRLATGFHDVGNYANSDTYSAVTTVQLAGERYPGVPFRLRDLIDYHELDWEQAGQLLERVMEVLAGRAPGPDETAEQIVQQELISRNVLPQFATRITLVDRVRPDEAAVALLNEMAGRSLPFDSEADRQVVEAVIRASVWAGLLDTQPAYVATLEAGVVERAGVLAEILEVADVIEAAVNLSAGEEFYRGRARDLSNVISSLQEKVEEQAISPQTLDLVLGLLDPRNQRQTDLMLVLSESRRIGLAGQTWTEGRDIEIIERAGRGERADQLVPFAQGGLEEGTAQDWLDREVFGIPVRTLLSRVPPELDPMLDGTVQVDLVASDLDHTLRFSRDEQPPQDTQPLIAQSLSQTQTRWLVITGSAIGLVGPDGRPLSTDITNWLETLEARFDTPVAGSPLSRFELYGAVGLQQISYSDLGVREMHGDQNAGAFSREDQVKVLKSWLRSFLTNELSLWPGSKEAERWLNELDPIEDPAQLQIMLAQIRDRWGITSRLHINRPGFDAQTGEVHPNPDLANYMVIDLPEDGSAANLSRIIGGTFDTDVRPNLSLNRPLLPTIAGATHVTILFDAKDGRVPSWHDQKQAELPKGGIGVFLGDDPASDTHLNLGAAQFEDRPLLKYLVDDHLAAQYPQLLLAQGRNADGSAWVIQTLVEAETAGQNYRRTPFLYSPQAQRAFSIADVQKETGHSWEALRAAAGLEERLPAAADVPLNRQLVLPQPATGTSGRSPAVTSGFLPPTSTGILTQAQVLSTLAPQLAESMSVFRSQHPRGLSFNSVTPTTTGLVVDLSESPELALLATELPFGSTVILSSREVLNQAQSITGKQAANQGIRVLYVEGNYVRALNDAVNGMRGFDAIRVLSTRDRYFVSASLDQGGRAIPVAIEANLNKRTLLANVGALPNQAQAAFILILEDGESLSENL